MFVCSPPQERRSGKESRAVGERVRGRVVFRRGEAEGGLGVATRRRKGVRAA